jgi:hypothetical protein
MKDIHPTNGLCITHLAQIDLGGFQVLVSEQDFGDDLKGHPIPAGKVG